MNVYEALSCVMRDVQAVRKGERNNAPGQGGFMFRGIDAVTNAVGPALRAHGVIVVPEVIESEYSVVESGQKRTLMSAVRLRVRFTWHGPEGDSVSCVTEGYAFDSGDKATSKAHSVAFRTAMIQTLALPTDEPDPDESSFERSQPADDRGGHAPERAQAQMPRPEVSEARARIANARTMRTLEAEWKRSVDGGYAPEVIAAVKERKAVLLAAAEADQAALAAEAGAVAGE